MKQQPNFEKEMKVAETAARSAGKILMDMFRKEMSQTRKQGRDFLTDADKAAEEAIIKTIKQNFPEHAILSEEAGESGNSRYRWVIDPLDGTHNFYYGIPIFGTMIALEVDDDIVLSTIYLPYTNELYKAVRGKGSFCNEKRIYVSKRKNKFMYLYSGMFNYYRNKKSRKLFQVTALKFSPAVRILGCAAFNWSLLASGSMDGSIKLNMPFWDMAAGILLFEEAGGKVTDINGNAWTNKTRDFIVSNGTMHKELLKISKELKL